MKKSEFETVMQAEIKTAAHNIDTYLNQEFPKKQINVQELLPTLSAAILDESVTAVIRSLEKSGVLTFDNE